MTLAADQDQSDNESTKPTGPTSVNGVKASELKNFIERIERVETSKAGMAADIKLIKDEAKSTGFDVKTLNAILKLRKMDASTIEAEELLLEAYKRALGMTD
jgi:uncharacterized protein (UPF0335 family)